MLKSEKDPIARRKTPDQIRAAIVSAAIEVIGRAGIGGLTHRAVAARAEVSLSSTTYHFASREDIIDAALRYVVDDERTRIQQGTARIESLDQQDPAKVRAAVTAMLQEIIASDFGGRIYLRAQYELQLYAVNQPSMQDGVRAWQDDIERLVTHLLALLDVREPAFAARIMVAAVDGLRLAALTTGQSPDDVQASSGAALAWLTELFFG